MLFCLIRVIRVNLRLFSITGSGGGAQMPLLHLPGLHVSYALFEAGGVDLVSLALLDCLLSNHQRFVFLACAKEHISFGGKVLKRWLDFDGLVEPLRA